MKIILGIGLVLAAQAAAWFAVKAWRGCKRAEPQRETQGRWSGKSDTRFEFEAAN